MVLPDPKQKPRTPPKPTAASKDPKGTAVGKGFETQLGTAKVETGAKGQGFGLSSGGTGGDGGVRLDVDFCCPEYIGDMRDRIIKNWNQNQRASGIVVMKYTIQRSGEITDIEVGSLQRQPSAGSRGSAGVNQHAHARAAAISVFTAAASGASHV